MADAIKYDDLFLYNRTNEASRKFRVFLDTHAVKYVNLQWYDEDQIANNIAALSTWFISSRPEGFSDLPILIYEKVLWEAPDGSDKYQKRHYSVDPGDLPPDWLDKVEKIT